MSVRTLKPVRPASLPGRRRAHDGQRSRSRRRPASRRGFLSMELALALPILGLVLMGLFEFSLLFHARGSVVEASRAGARLASLPGVEAEAVEDTVRMVLAPRLRQGLRVRVERGEHAGDVVSVGVAVPMSDASPDLLWPVGFGLQGRDLYHETRMICE